MVKNLFYLNQSNFPSSSQAPAQHCWAAFPLFGFLQHPAILSSCILVGNQAVLLCKFEGLLMKSLNQFSTFENVQNDLNWRWCELQIMKASIIQFAIWIFNFAICNFQFLHVFFNLRFVFNSMGNFAFHLLFLICII